MNLRSTLGVAALLPALEPAAAWAQPWGYWRHPMMSDGGWSFMILGPFFLLLPLAILVAIVFFIARMAGGPWRVAPPSSDHTALDILRERFARGEIDQQEFESRRRVLTESANPPK